MKISGSQYHRAYLAGLELYDGKIGIANAKRRLAPTGINSNSAADLIYNVGHLLRGERYKRAMSFGTTDDFLTWLRRDRGETALKAAVAAVAQHLDYFEQKRHVRLKAHRKVLAKHRELLGAVESVVRLEWNDADSRDYVDILPLSFFEKQHKLTGVTHITRHKSGREYLSKCDVLVRAADADLDYEPYAAFNRSQGMLVGVARIRFADSDRTAIAAAEWKPEKEQKFSPTSFAAPKYETPPAPPYIPPTSSAGKKWQAVTQRPGQVKFRKNLKSAYEQRCCITGCAVPEALEGAHIDAYKSPASDNLRNGLLLRRDVHALYDKHLIAIEPETLLIRVTTSVRDLVGYAQLHDTKLTLPKDTSHYPDPGALKRRWKKFKQ